MTKRINQTVVFIRWNDASYERGEKTADEIDPGCVLHSSGILIKDDNEFISMATDYFLEEETFRHITHIPKVNILTIRRMRL